MKRQHKKLMLLSIIFIFVVLTIITIFKPSEADYTSSESNKITNPSIKEMDISKTDKQAPNKDANMFNEQYRQQFENIANAYSENASTPPYSIYITANQLELTQPYSNIPTAQSLTEDASVQGLLTIDNDLVLLSTPLKGYLGIKYKTIKPISVIFQIINDGDVLQSFEGKGAQVINANELQYQFNEEVKLNHIPAKLYKRLTIRALIKLSNNTTTALANTFEYALKDVATLKQVAACQVEGADLVFPMIVDIKVAGYYQINAVLSVQDNILGYLSAEGMYATGEQTIPLKAHISLLKKSQQMTNYSLSAFRLQMLSIKPGDPEYSANTNLVKQAPCAGFAFNAYKDEPYKDPMLQERLDFLKKMGNNL